MSRTIRLHHFGSADVLKCEEYTQRTPAADEVLICVQAIGVNWDDVLWRQGLGSSPAHLPAGLGSEMAGVVEAVGTQVQDLQPGDRVASFQAMNINEYPVYGDHILLPRNALTRYPEQLSPQQASVHYTPLLMAWFAYVELAQVKAGQTVLVTDAALSPNIAFVQLGKALGINVIASTKDADDRQYLLDRGAAHVIVTDEQDLGMRVAKLTDGRGVQAVFDGLGGPQMSLLGDVLSTRGTLVLFGLRGGNKTPFPAIEAFRKNIRFFVHCLCNFTGKSEFGIPQNAEALDKALQAINQLTVEQGLTSDIDRVFRFEQAAKAHDYMEYQPGHGRIVLSVE
jgi:NADPH2:quinone reductase